MNVYDSMRVLAFYDFIHKRSTPFVKKKKYFKIDNRAQHLFNFIDYDQSSQKLKINSENDRIQNLISNIITTDSAISSNAKILLQCSNGYIHVSE